MYIPTMSLCELVERLRSLGIRTSNPTAAAMIEAGRIPSPRRCGWRRTASGCW